MEIREAQQPRMQPGLRAGCDGKATEDHRAREEQQNASSPGSGEHANR